VHPIAVALAWAEARQVNVPYLVGLLGDGDSRLFVVTLRSVKQAEFDCGCIFGKEGKVDPFSIPRGTKWIRHSGARGWRLWLIRGCHDSRI